jgi:hypothetical protein
MLVRLEQDGPEVRIGDSRYYRVTSPERSDSGPDHTRTLRQHETGSMMTIEETGSFHPIQVYISQ